MSHFLAILSTAEAEMMEVIEGRSPVSLCWRWQARSSKEWLARFGQTPSRPKPSFAWRVDHGEHVTCASELRQHDKLSNVLNGFYSKR